MILHADCICGAAYQLVNRPCRRCKHPVRIADRTRTYGYADPISAYICLRLAGLDPRNT